MADNGEGAGPDYTGSLGTGAGRAEDRRSKGRVWLAVFCGREVDQCVKSAASQFATLGATVEEISIPEHLTGPAIWGAVVTDGLWQTMKLNGVGFNHEDIYSPALYRSNGRIGPPAPVICPD